MELANVADGIRCPQCGAETTVLSGNVLSCISCKARLADWLPDEHRLQYDYTILGIAEDMQAAVSAEKAEWDAWLEYFESRARENDREVPDYAPIPDTKPAYMNLHAGEDGTVWVRRYAKARKRDRPPREPDDPRPTFNWWQPITLDAFDEEGAFLGTVELPNETWVSALHRDWIWTVQPNEDEESVAIRYRIEQGPR